MFTSITSPLDNILYYINWIRLETWPVYRFLLLTWLYTLLLIIYLWYGITTITSCIIYYYRACIILVSITASFILPLTRSLSDDPGFACPGWRSESPYYQIVPWSYIGDSSSRLVIGILLIYFCYLIYPHFSYMLWSLTSFCRYSCTYFLLGPMSIWR